MRARDERGSVSIQLVILLPALFAVMFLGMQAALFYHARTVAIAAAQEGAKAAGGENGKESDGVQAAEAFIAEAGGDDVLTGATTTASASAVASPMPRAAPVTRATFGGEGGMGRSVCEREGLPLV